MPDQWWMGGVACMAAALVTNPVDVVKTRIQLTPGTPFFSGLTTIVRTEGPLALYKGISPAMWREATYSTLRLGLYEPAKQLFSNARGVDMPFYQKLIAGCLSGGLGAAISNPFDLYKVRAQAAKTEAPYRSIGHFFATVWRADGVRGLFRGVGPTVQRAAILTGSQLSSYDHTKHTLLAGGWLREGLGVHAVASVVAGLACATTTAPIDRIKTLMMVQKHPNAWVCAVACAREGGLRSLWAGWLANWFRLAPHTLVCFVMLEQMRKHWGMTPF